MSERMSDKRFDVIDTNVRMPGMCTGIDWEAIGAELWNALKAERAKAKELEAIIERVSSVISTWDSELYGNQIYAIEIALFPTTLKPKEGE